MPHQLLIMIKPLRLLYIVLTLSTMLSAKGNAQSIVRSVVSSGGKYLFNSTGGLYVNIGELQVNTYTAPNNIITQGFVQPFIPFPVIVPSQNEPSQEISMFPNPSSNLVYLSASQNMTATVSIYDTQGRLLVKNENVKLIKSTQYTLPVASFMDGIYFINITDEKGNNHLFRFVKI